MTSFIIKKGIDNTFELNFVNNHVDTYYNLSKDEFIELYAKMRSIIKGLEKNENKEMIR